ncbi:hypothetical protein ABTM23_19560, partial [Acinetobacter baumannii]
DVIIIDCPAGEYEFDLDLMTELVDRVVVVTRVNYSLMYLQQQFAKKLQQYSKKFLGVVLNDSVPDHD